MEIVKRAGFGRGMEKEGTNMLTTGESWDQETLQDSGHKSLHACHSPEGAQYEEQTLMSTTGLSW